MSQDLYVVVVTGSRRWTNSRALSWALAYVQAVVTAHGFQRLLLIEGEAPGLDVMAAATARQMGWEVEGKPADWDAHGLGAGHARNQEMVDLAISHGASGARRLCLGFPLEDSRGTWDCLERADKAGLPCIVVGRYGRAWRWNRSLPRERVPPITSFTGANHFLSNFYTGGDTCWTFKGVLYRNAEAAFQAHKTLDPKLHATIAGMNPIDAKRAGRSVPLRPDWEQVKDQVMLDVLYAKFRPEGGLLGKLLETWPARLEEGNTWNDTYWGTVNGLGLNKLGNLLMQVRERHRNPAYYD